MNLLYLTKKKASNSESFISDAVNLLNSNSDISLYLASLAKDYGEIENKVTYPLGNALSGILEKIIAKLNHFKKLHAIKTLLVDIQKNVFSKNLLSLIKKYEIDILYIDYGTFAISVYECLIDNNIPYGVHVHGYDASKMLNDIVDRDYSKNFAKMANHAKFVISPSNHLRRRIMLAGAIKANILISPCPPNFNMITHRSDKYKEPTIVALGRLTSKKNPVATLYAFKHVVDTLPNAILHIIGDGPEKRRVEAEIERLNLTENVVLHGALNREKSFPIIAKSHVFVQHSVTSGEGDQEGFPVALAEAAAHALPIVSTIHSGITENVIDEETGYLVQEHDFETMGERIVELLINPDRAKALGENGKKRILKICDIKTRQKLLENALRN